jgi:hypothetical protein
MATRQLLGQPGGRDGGRHLKCGPFSVIASTSEAGLANLLQHVVLRLHAWSRSPRLPTGHQPGDAEAPRPAF